MEMKYAWCKCCTIGPLPLHSSEIDIACKACKSLALGCVTKTFSQNFQAISKFPISFGPNIMPEKNWPSPTFFSVYEKKCQRRPTFFWRNLVSKWNGKLADRWEIPGKSFCDTSYLAFVKLQSVLPGQASYPREVHQ